MSLELQVNPNKNNREMPNSFVSLHLVCQDMKMMASARDAVEFIIRGTYAAVRLQCTDT